MALQTLPYASLHKGDAAWKAATHNAAKMAALHTDVSMERWHLKLALWAPPGIRPPFVRGIASI